MKIAVASHDTRDAVLTHQDGDMQVMHQVSTRFRQLVQALPEHGRMSTTRGGQTQSRARQQRADKAPGRLAGQGIAIDAWVGGHTQEFVADAQGQKLRRCLSARTFEQLPARPMKFTVSIDCVQEDVGVDDKHATGSAALVHPFIQRIAVDNVDQRTAAVPLR